MVNKDFVKDQIVNVSVCRPYSLCLNGSTMRVSGKSSQTTCKPMGMTVYKNGKMSGLGLWAAVN